MEYLIAITYPSPEVAADVRETLIGMRSSGEIVLSDAITASRTDHGVTLDHLFDPRVLAPAATTAWGTVVGALFGMPIVGAGVGAVTGLVGAAFTDRGIPDSFAREVADQTGVDRATLLVLLETSDIVEAARKLRRPGAMLAYTDMPKSDERDVISAVQPTRLHSSPPPA